MKYAHHLRSKRRTFLRACLGVSAGSFLAACTGRTGETPSAAQAPTTVATSVPPQPTVAEANAPATATLAEPTAAAASTLPATQAPQAQVLPPTPECSDDDDEITPAQTEGPYYTPSTPERTSLLESGINGTKLVLTGQVLTTGCTPIARALVDFWHADDAGAYDNVGFRLRGHQFTDDQGNYTLETIMPGLYTGRTRHIHVKVQPPNQSILTTQLYFPDEPDNQRDGIFNAALVVDLQDDADGKAARFDFVLDSA